MEVLTEMSSVEQKEERDLPQQEYEVVYADPPWRYDQGTCRPSDAIEERYPTMELHEIKALHVPAADSAVLYMWATAPKLSEGIEVVDAWGFEYKTCAVWDKQRLGLGHWFRINHELLLVGVRNGYPTPDTDARRKSIFSEERREHSRKPDKVRRHIERAHPEASKIELFAREGHVGWDVWGNEVPDSKQSKLTISEGGEQRNE